MPFDFRLNLVAVEPPKRMSAQRVSELIEESARSIADHPERFTVEHLPPLAENPHDDQMDAMYRGIDWGDPAGDRTVIINPEPAARQPEPIMQTLRVSYRASTTDGEITDTYDLLTHRRYLRTITEALHGVGDHITRIDMSGPRYGSTVRCITMFLEALRAVAYLKGQCLLSITEISIL